MGGSFKGSAYHQGHQRNPVLPGREWHPVRDDQKIYEGRPNIDDAIKNKEIQLVINTPIGKASQYDDSYIRKAAIRYKVPYITTIAAASAAAKG